VGVNGGWIFELVCGIRVITTSATSLYSVWFVKHNQSNYMLADKSNSESTNGFPVAASSRSMTIGRKKNVWPRLI